MVELVPNRYRSIRCSEISDRHAGSTVRLAGWIAAKRDHGGLLFLDLRDSSGLVQLVSHPDDGPFETLSRLRVESVIAMEGLVVNREEKDYNPKLSTGTVEVAVTSVDVLSSAEVLPFPVERDTDVSEEMRLRYRYLDMRRGPLLERLGQRALLAQLVRTHLSERGFLEVQTPILTASSPEGARDFLVPSRLYPGEFYALPQAPQQFKQLLMVGGVERYFQIAPCFRDEASRADRSPGEFYQIDLEMAFATQEDVFDEVEQLMARVTAELSNKRTKAPFPRLTFAESVAQYGTDKPDLRFDLSIEDLTGQLGGETELPMFQQAPAKGQAIRALRIPEGAARSRRWFDTFADRAKRAGVTGSWLQLDQQETKGPLAKKLTDDETQRIVQTTGAEPGDAILVTVGPAAKASVVLGEQRTSVGRELGLADPEELVFCWVVDFPMYEWNEDTKSWDFSHN
ncbi:MAG TPA: aspartate--tRNA ligase, partial [Acidimicrobiales bacterium]|nr:aspartate--tRNA ligase [Acidimicrobiales bacterium]